MHNFSNAVYDGAAVDVWAAGIVLFILLFGRHPFLRPADSSLPEQQQMLALFTRTAASQFCLLPEEAGAITHGCADLLAHILQTNPKLR
jgi:serine/threonine protein kinase